MTTRRNLGKEVIGLAKGLAQVRRDLKRLRAEVAAKETKHAEELVITVTADTSDAMKHIDIAIAKARELYALIPRTRWQRIKEWWRDPWSNGPNGPHSL